MALNYLTEGEEMALEVSAPGKTSVISFENICVDVQTKRILWNVTGSVDKGEILAIMGPSGGGKSTLLNALAGYTPISQGSVLVRGRKINKRVRRKISYVLQSDIFFPDLTLRETLIYSALLRLPSSLGFKKKVQKVDGVIKTLGLQGCQNTIIGSPVKRGLSGGEKKRCNIACEMLTDPFILLLDEPTSGLDSSSALSLFANLKKLAVNDGKTIITSIHQPSSQLFYNFDKLLLLAKGKVAYYGPAQSVMEYFSSVGLHCTLLYNPADYILEMVSDPESRKLLIGSDPPETHLAEETKWWQKVWPVSTFYQLYHSRRRASKALLPTSTESHIAIDVDEKDTAGGFKGSSFPNGSGAASDQKNANFIIMPAKPALTPIVEMRETPTTPEKKPFPNFGEKEESHDRSGISGKGEEEREDPTSPNDAISEETVIERLSEVKDGPPLDLVTASSSKSGSQPRGSNSQPSLPGLVTNSRYRGLSSTSSSSSSVGGRRGTTVTTFVEDAHLVSEEVKTKEKKWVNPWYVQFLVLCHRTFKQSKASLLSPLNIIQTLLLTLASSIVWFRIPYHEASIQDKYGMVFFACIYWSFQGCFLAVSIFPSDRLVVSKERAAGSYHLSAYYLAKTISEAPLVMLLPTIFLIFVFPIGGMPTAGSFFGAWLTVLMSCLTLQSLGLLLGAMLDGPKALTLCVVLMLSLMLLGGFYVQELPFWIDWAKYVSPITYAYRSALQFIFTADSYYVCDTPSRFSVCLVNATAPEGGAANVTRFLSGADVLRDLGVDTHHALNFCMLIAFALILRTGAYLALRFCHRQRSLQ